MPKPLAIVPWPRRVEQGRGCFRVAGVPWSVSAEATASAAVAHKLRALGLRCRPRRGLPPHTLVAGEPANGARAPEHAEGYALSISPRGLVLRGHDAAGLFWGLVTLEQLLARGRDLACLEIRDWPAVALRGHHDDISRKQVSTVDDFRRILRTLSRYKINCYTPYMEDMLHLASHPDIGEGRGKLMPDEVRAIVREAELQNVLVMPTFSLIGHQENLLRLPRYAPLGRAVFQPPSTLDPENPAVRTFLRSVIADVCALFPGPYFHMGFDETQGLTADAWFAHANWCAAELRKHGKTAVLWADMIYNHYGYDSVRRLDRSIVLVDWQYDDVSRGVPHWRDLARQGRPLWGLAGYGNCACFLPDFERSKRHFADWVRQLEAVPAPALFSSMWGDEGYENSRDLCWNLFASFAENAWSGADARPATFERRFQETFYGAPLPRLERLVREIPRQLALGPGEWWALHRRTLPSLRRVAAADRRLEAKIGRDERRLKQALGDVAASRRLARREADHLDHFEVALGRMLSVAHRLQLACRLNRRLSASAARAAVRRVRKELAAVRRRYAEVWLRHNKRENIDVSLEVFDRVDRSLAALFEKPPAPRPGTFLPLDLSRRHNRNFLDVGGVPIGETVVNGVPFHFAGLGRTHLALRGKGRRLTLRMGPARMRDLHLIVTSPRPAEWPRPALRVEWLRRGKAVFTEDLLSVRHLCDWWAPMGEHIWAGGGFRYIDPMRVRFALSPAHLFGLMHVSGFPTPGTPVVDAVRLTCLTDTEVQLFAATAEVVGEPLVPSSRRPRGGL